MSDFLAEITGMGADYAPTDEEDRDFWSGEGHLSFTVTANRHDVFEIDTLEYSGCVGGFDEGLGLEFGLREGHLGVDPSELKEGYTYHFDGITVSHTCGDGWTTDDDAEYYVGNVTSERLPIRQFVPLLLRNWWWFSFGWKIREWRNSQ